MTDDSTWPDWMQRCAHCGERLLTEIRCPVTTTTDANGDLSFHSFCSSPCQSAWEEASSSASD